MAAELTPVDRQTCRLCFMLQLCSAALLILRPVCCVMSSYKFSQYDTAASILLFMKCISSTLQAQAGELQCAPATPSSLRRRSRASAIKAYFDGSFFIRKSAFRRRFVEMQTNVGLRRYFITPLMMVVNEKPVRLRRSTLSQFLLLQPFAQMTFMRKYKYLLLNKATFHQRNEMLLAQIPCRCSTDVFTAAGSKPPASVVFLL